MKILFINVSIRPDADWTQFPVGLGYVMTAVKHAGYDFDVLDIDINKYTDDEVEAHIRTHQYDVVAFGTIVTHYRWSRWLIETVKKHQPGCCVIVGNSVAESIPEVLFGTTPVDIVVLGEGDVTIVEVLDALNAGESLGHATEPLEEISHNNGDFPAAVRGSGIDGICFRDENNRVINNGRRKAVRKLDDIPFPDWDLLDVERYIESGSRNFRGRVTRYPSDKVRPMPVTTARGCVFKCSFCHYTFWHDPYRHRSPENIIAEIRHNQEKYGANYFNFWDDLSFHKLGPTEKFLDALIDADVDIHFTAAIRSDLMGRAEIPYEERRRVAEKFRQAGAVVLGYSLESGDDDILVAMNKRVQSDYFKEQYRLIREVGGIVSLTSLVIGYPQETKETIRKSMKMCEELGIYPSPGFLLPLPGTGMWNYALENGYIADVEEYLMEMTERQDVVVNMTSMSDKELVGEVTDSLQELSDRLDLGFSGGKLMRTGGFQHHGKNQVKKLEADVSVEDTKAPEFNYAKMQGGM